MYITKSTQGLDLIARFRYPELKLLNAITNFTQANATSQQDISLQASITLAAMQTVIWKYIVSLRAFYIMDIGWLEYMGTLL
jgi:hypothetical protein